MSACRKSLDSLLAFTECGQAQTSYMMSMWIVRLVEQNEIAFRQRSRRLAGSVEGYGKQEFRLQVI
jgi:hypothetical protein